jgi:hypothetical protein
MMWIGECLLLIIIALISLIGIGVCVHEIQEEIRKKN